ncbi:MAG: phenylalanine--tRNA ligase subunit beta [Armatimonadetes bacterium 13_1_40CM_64_14]|nr:MAG: phenylalanine--tRNA ligase subunit beta [Armatimonadetes bacterium 13_1_40CM_64_14]
MPTLGLGTERVEPHESDAVFDLELPANRGDLMCHVGVARELAAANRSAIRLPATAPRRDRSERADAVHVDVREPQLCPRFTAVLIADVRVGPSPRWLARRLDACGVRSINNVVDVTNYVMLELGQPMHAFDYDLLQGGRLTVRFAVPGERLTTLDGVTRVLDARTLVVADATRVVSIGGIIGGTETEITASTRRVLLEAAIWDPSMIRRTAMRVGVRTESSARFERGVDIGGADTASARAQQLLIEVAGGRIASDMLDRYPSPQPPRQLAVHWPRVGRLLGIEVAQAQGEVMLRSLGFGVTKQGDKLTVTVPSFRRDVERAEDLIEEVARHHGYDRIPEAMPVEATAQATRAPILDAQHAVRDVLIRTGLTEVLTVPLTTPAVLDGLRLPSDHPWRAMVPLRNPLIEDHTHLRTTLLAGLLQVARGNIHRRVMDVLIFEVGRTFHPSGAAVLERRGVAVLMTGRLLRGAWNTPEQVSTATFFHLKGVVESLVSELRIGRTLFAPATVPWLHPGRAAQVSMTGQPLGTLGELHPDVAAAAELPPGVYVAELDLDEVLRHAVFQPQFTPLPKYPSVRRDLAVVVPDGVSAAEVERVIEEAGGDLLEAAELFDVYSGPPVPPGHRNLAYALSLRSSDRTLSASDVAAAVGRITGALQTKLRATIRE